MNICGLQKLTLLDYPGRTACTVFLGGCDMRCPFCHNYELAVGAVSPVMTDEELMAFLDKRRGILDGVVFTGGEPCLHPDIPELIAAVRDKGFLIKLDTNGLHPELLSEMFSQKLLDYVAMDIKNSRAGYAETAGIAGERMDISAVMRSIELIMQSGVEYEFRTTVVKELHEGSDFHDIGQMIRGAERYFLQSFTDRDTVPVRGLHSPDPSDLARYAEIMGAYVREVHIRGVDIPLNRNDTVL